MGFFNYTTQQLMWKDQGPPTQIEHKTLTSLENRKMLPHDFFIEESSSFLLVAGPLNDVIARAFFKIL